MKFYTNEIRIGKSPVAWFGGCLRFYVLWSMGNGDEVCSVEFWGVHFFTFITLNVKSGSQ